MAISKLKIYKTDITPEKNMVIDHLDEFLTNKCTLTYQEDKFQYQRININSTISIAAPQENVGKSIGNYCTIEQDDRVYYYFITNATWASTNTVKLQISLDTLNTFANDLEFSDKTTIQREHIDRFTRYSGQPIDTFIAKKKAIRCIDRQPEGTTLRKELISNKKIEEKAGNFNWYLIYKTRDNLSPDNLGNPIECDLIAEEPLLIKKGHIDSGTQTILPTFFENNKTYFMDPISNPKAKIHFIRDVGGNPEFTLELKEDGSQMFRFGVVNGRIAVNLVSFKKAAVVGDDPEAKGDAWVDYGEQGWGATKQIDFIQSSEVKSTTEYLKCYNDIVNLKNTKPIVAGTSIDKKLIGIADVDKTDNRLMKIIKLPYCPVNVSVSTNGEYIFPKEWEYYNGVMKLKTHNLSSEFENDLDKENITKYFKITLDVTPKSQPDNLYESKILNSEFYTLKYVYDSFPKEIKLENYSIEPGYSGGDIYLPIKFKQTNTVNSNMAFKFDTNANAFYSYKEESDYDNYLLVKRNNEETIFSNDYINYMRNGYNYDKKQAERGIIFGTVSTLLGLGSAGTAFGIGRYNAGKQGMAAFDTGAGAKWEAAGLPGPMLGALRGHAGQSAANAMSPFLSAAAISAGFNAANGALNTVHNAIEAYQNIARKQDELAAQSTAVSGADDIDLLDFYNGNKLEKKEYSTEKIALNAMSKLFYYTGYNHPIQELPNIKSRYWFNYLQCIPVFKNENNSIYTDYLDDIRARFLKGVTYYHHHSEIDTGWDINQEYENWEVKFLDTTYLPSAPYESVGITNITVDPKNQKHISWQNIPGEEVTDISISALKFDYAYLEGGHIYFKSDYTTKSNQTSIQLSKLPIGAFKPTVTKINKWNKDFNSPSIYIK